MNEEGKSIAGTGNPQSQYYYGTFQGVANYYPPPPQPLPQVVIGFPQPVRPQGSSIPDPRFPANGYQTVQGYAVPEGWPMRQRRLPCCGMGMGWLLFLLGFFLGGVPWYVGTFIVLCVHVDYREKPGYVACTIASILAMLAITFGVTKGSHACSFWMSSKVQKLEHTKIGGRIGKQALRM